MSDNSGALPSPLLFSARADSVLFKFIQANNGNPRGITIEAVEQLVVKYVLKYLLRYDTNPCVVWPDVLLSNILGGIQAYHSAQLSDILR